MKLPVMPPVKPMLAKAVSGLPDGDDLVFEPKWDGFRCIVFRDGDEVELGSRNEKPLTRYFPELVESLKQHLPERCAIDGEIVMVTDNELNFDGLQNRIHPAASRVNMLAKETPTSFVAFDLLALDNVDLRENTFAERRSLLEKIGSNKSASFYVTPATDDREIAARWFKEFEGAGLDGLVAKSSALQYLENKRAMMKIKHERTADCVVAGFRWHKSGPIVGSLLLGLYDEDGVLHHAGITASFTAVRRAELVEELAPLRMDDFEGHPWEAWTQEDGDGTRKPGATSRWNAKKDLSWMPLRPEQVVEVAYDHLQGDRFRHATTFKRWRFDRDPESCCYDQLEEPAAHPFDSIFE